MAQCLEHLLIPVDVTHTSKGFKPKPYSICEAHSPGPEQEHTQISFIIPRPVHWVGYLVVKQQEWPHPSQDPSGLCTFLQYSSPSLRVDLKDRREQTHNLCLGPYYFN